MRRLSRSNEPNKTYPKPVLLKAGPKPCPLSDNRFDLIHTSVAMHEMEPDQRRQIFREVWRVLKPNGTFTMVDFHKPLKSSVLAGDD